MSITHSLANALSGLTASSRMAEVVSSNLANVMTDGYGRRSVDLSAQSVGGRGAGVQIDGVSRYVNRGVLGDRRLADAGVAGYQFSSVSLGRLEQTLGQAGDVNGLSARIAAFEQSLVTAASDPSSDVRLGVSVDRLQDVVRSVRDGELEIRTLRQDADAAIASDVDRLNTSLKQVELLNADITYSRNTGQDPSALMDQRQQVIDAISKIVPLRELDRPGGQVALMTTSGQMLVDGPAKQFGFDRTNTITADMTLSSGALSGLTLNGQPVNGSNGIGKLEGGSLGAAFAMRDKTLPGMQAELDAVARDLVERFQDKAVDPTLAPGDAGLLTDRGAAFDPLNEVGLSGRLALNAAVDPKQGGAVRNLRDGVNAVTPGPAGSAEQLDRFLGAMTAIRPTSTGSGAASAAGNAARFTGSISSAILTVEENLSFANARWDTLRHSELAGGVDTDHELQMLMRIEQSFAANARVIQTVDSLMQTLMEL